jgi:hypothetical protein
VPAWCHEEEHENWRWSVCREDFDRYLGIGSDRLNLWGRWVTIWGRREESVHVASALVSPDRSESLLRAWQTARNFRDFRIPDADDESQIDAGAFQLKGWVVNRTQERELDRLDLWSGDIGYPPIKPACDVINQMGLLSDSEHRAWRIKGKEQEGAVLCSQLWGRCTDSGDENETMRGRRLQASPAFATELLRVTGMDLILAVEIERQTRRLRYERHKDDDFEYILPSTMLFLVKSDGTVHGL